jgi:hypothetical protein
VRGFYVCVTAAALAVSAFVGVAVAAQPCGKAVIDDWYDDGTIDRVWDCECLRDAIDLLQDIDRGPPYSAKDYLQRQINLGQCGGSNQQTVSATLGTPTASPGSDKSIGVSDDSFAWEVALVAGLALGLAALVGMAVQRQWRRRRS